MARLIDAFQEVDRTLTYASAVQFEPVLLLERVEAGSVRAWLRTVLREVNDDALLHLDWRPVFGQYLVRGKHVILRWLDGRRSIRDRQELVQLQQDLIALTPQPITQLLPPAPIPPARLLEGIKRIVDATEELRDTDTVRYVSPQEAETALPRELRLTSEDVEQLLTQEVIRTESRLQLLIKKPDYLGNSRWEFRFDDRVIEGKVLDEPWLRSFRAGHVPLRPGDALDADVRAELYRGFEGQPVTTHYFIEHVHGVVHGQEVTQIDLDFPDG